ncbi:MAG: hypothetical protein A2148_03750 [Chloroflexi bacterium RBG_16_68_14]|nr:MAG: hypothetical protein A2148_03750 [Chloroflexi bacterium RBG_16_68_14]
MDQPPTPTQRVSAIPFPERYDLPGKPQGASTQAQDAYRQTTFVLGDDLHLFAEGMNLQLRIVRDASPSAFRTHPYAALMGLWSRTFLALADTCLLVTRGSYPSCLSLVRAACEHIAAQHQLHASEMELVLEWLAGHLRPNEQHKALEFGLGRYFAGETLASDQRLRRVYRPASELGRPNFGATLLQVGPESNNQRLALTFADASFHLGWAEIVLGWLLALCERQLAVAVHAQGVFPIHEDTHRAHADLARRVEQTLSRPDRCSIEEVEEEHGKRYLAHNFRRAPGAAHKKILL